MSSSELANFVIWVMNFGIVILTCLVIYGCVKKKIYGHGRWHYYGDKSTQYFQIVIGYSIMIAVLCFFRFGTIAEGIFEAAKG